MEEQSKQIKPEDINYDAPLAVTCIIHEDDSRQVVQRRMLLQWVNIDYIEEYFDGHESIIDWKELKGKPKMYIVYNNYSHLVLFDFDEFSKYWIYYQTKVRIVNNYQTPNVMRRK